MYAPDGDLVGVQARTSVSANEQTKACSYIVANSRVFKRCLVFRLSLLTGGLVWLVD
jgi:hypothetical protein